MTFDEVLLALKAGRKARRALWRQLGETTLGAVELTTVKLDDGRPVMPLLLCDHDGVMRPFAGAQWDLLADDWELL